MPDMWNLNWWLVLLYYWQQDVFTAMFHFCLFKPSIFCSPCQILMETLYSEDKLWILETNRTHVFTRYWRRTSFAWNSHQKHNSLSAKRCVYVQGGLMALLWLRVIEGFGLNGTLKIIQSNPPEMSRDTFHKCMLLRVSSSLAWT